MFPSQRNGVHEKTRGSHAVGLRKQDKQRTKNETNKLSTKYILIIFWTAYQAKKFGLKADFDGRATAPRDRQ